MAALAHSIRCAKKPASLSTAYRLMYLLGFTPWDRVHPQELIEIIEGPEALPPGRALDLGSGKGGKSIYMASHGWKVTAIDNVPRAVAQARKRAAEANATVDFRLGDVTRLPDVGLEPGFNLVFDFGCYHGMKSAQKDAYAQGVTSLAAPGARLLMMWPSPRPLPRCRRACPNPSWWRGSAPPGVRSGRIPPGPRAIPR